MERYEGKIFSGNILRIADLQEEIYALKQGERIVNAPEHKSNSRYLINQYTRHSSGPKPSGSSGNNKYCTYYNKYRHTVETCSKKHGYPPSYKSRPYSTAHSIITDSHQSFNDKSKK